jgi:hypothetical protein
VHDHTWKQVGIGAGAGALWGLLIWIISRWIVAYFLMEYMMSFRLIRAFFKNDYDPDFRRSKWKGAKYAERTKNKPQKERVNFFVNYCVLNT